MIDIYKFFEDMLINEEIEMTIQGGCLAYDIFICKIDEDEYYVSAKDISTYSEDFEKNYNIKELIGFFKYFTILDYRMV